MSLFYGDKNGLLSMPEAAQAHVQTLKFADIELRVLAVASSRPLVTKPLVRRR